MDSLASNTRRHFLHDCGVGLGKIALGTLLAQSGSAAFAGGVGDIREGSGDAAAGIGALPGLPHTAPRAKRVIYLFMAGAPSQLELFDYKPRLKQLQGKPIPPSVIQGQRYAFIQPDAAVLGPQFKFSKHGNSGAELSEMLPHLGRVADHIAIVRSMHTDLFNHAPAQLFVNTGNGVPGQPSMGAWLSYGLGSDADDLPAFVVLKGAGNLSGGASLWSNGFLPGRHQGVPFRSGGDPILHASNPPGVDLRAQRDALDLIGELNRQQSDAIGDPEIATRISAYEMAFRMQMRAPELMDFTQETASTMRMYGADPADPKKSFANNCLLARRLAERGVRFIQVYHAGWDHHSNVKGGVQTQTMQTDQGAAALVEDLRQRGMLDDTLLVWGGEFGRTPMVEASAALNRSGGRDHHPQAFSIWLAGGGIKPGITYGATDELGFNIAENPVHVQDLHATILKQLGIDHKKFTFRYRGLNVRLTGVQSHQPVDALIS